MRGAYAWEAQMQVTIKSEVGEILEYLGRLKCETVDELVGSIVNEWLAENYCRHVDPWEHAFGLPTTVLANRQGDLSEKAAYRVMKQNMRRLSA